MKEVKTTHIAPSLIVNGTLIFSGDLVIEGKVIGNIIPSEEKGNQGRNIIITENADIQSKEITAKNITVAGKVSCEALRASEAIVLNKSARIVDGSIYFHTLKIEKGAVLENCKLEHKPWPRCGRDGDMGGIFNV